MRLVKPKIQRPSGGQRGGRGFSPQELKNAGLNRAEAARLGIPADLRRKTAHDENVEAVKTYLEKKKAEAKPAIAVDEEHVEVKAHLEKKKAEAKPKPKKKPKS